MIDKGLPWVALCDNCHITVAKDKAARRLFCVCRSIIVDGRDGG
ncbi:protein of unknown function (plasmid) [Azospirillum lipoferum 4B]|uniref:Uncharacterized protein n=1 Tax=Azospirillum lipoferum (strain 4B) TaxID=862719 RepID=G7ZHF6_AZOL4|nr:protein of unknown function [Azospirillum lipoferum 4B]